MAVLSSVYITHSTPDPYVNSKALRRYSERTPALFIHNFLSDVRLVNDLPITRIQFHTVWVHRKLMA